MNVNQSKDTLRVILIAGLVVGSGIFLSLFNRWETSPETWGYWLFARIFAESGKFIILDRSPIYVLYLNTFRWLGYPNSATAEYIVTSLIVCAALVLFFRPYFGRVQAALAVFLWIPFMQTAEPPVQKLALAAAVLAVVLRRARTDRFATVGVYALLGLAFLFRSTYGVLIILFIAYDVWRARGAIGRPLDLLKTARPRLGDWPLLVVLGLLLWFAAAQSPNPWNNAWFGNTTWFPVDGKSLTQASFVQHSNAIYIESKYRNRKNIDFYFTNKDLHKGATSMVGALKANPRFFLVNIVGGNIRRLVSGCISLTGFPTVYSRLPFGKVVVIPIIFAIVLGAFRAAKDETTGIFVAGSLLLAGVTVLAFPKQRYLVPLIPVWVLSASWYGGLAKKFINRRPSLSGLAPVMVPLTLAILSTGAADWGKIGAGIVKDSARGELRVMENRGFSMKASYPAIEPLVKKSSGILALESTFIGAFMNVPIETVHDVWEIPPFGSLGAKPYSGLNADRIDAVLISTPLSRLTPLATNYQPRFDNYIAPYARQLQRLGARTYYTTGYGRVIIYKNRKATTGKRG